MSTLESRRVINPILSNIAKVAALQGTGCGFMLFPELGVSQHGGQLLTYDSEHFMLADTTRSPGDCPAQIRPGTYTGTRWALKSNALEGVLPWEEITAAQVPRVQLERNTIFTVQEKLNLGREVEQATKARDPNSYDAGSVVTLAGVNQWGDAASDPAGVIDAAQETIRQSIGVYANTLIVPAAVNIVLKRHPDILDAFKYTQTGILDDSQLRQYFGIQNYCVPTVVYADSSGNFIDVWGKDVILAYVAPTNTGMQLSQARPAFGYTLTMNNHPMVEPTVSERRCKTNYYPVFYDYTPEIFCQLAGFLIRDAVA